MADNIVDIGFRYDIGDIKEIEKNIGSAVQKAMNNIDASKITKGTVDQIKQLENVFKDFQNKTNASISQIEGNINQITSLIPNIQTAFNKLGLEIDLSKPMKQVEDFSNKMQQELSKQSIKMDNVKVDSKAIEKAVNDVAKVAEKSLENGVKTGLENGISSAAQSMNNPNSMKAMEKAGEQAGKTYVQSWADKFKKRTVSAEIPSVDKVIEDLDYKGIVDRQTLNFVREIYDYVHNIRVDLTQFSYKDFQQYLNEKFPYYDKKGNPIDNKSMYYKFGGDIRFEEVLRPMLNGIANNFPDMIHTTFTHDLTAVLVEDLKKLKDYARQPETIIKNLKREIKELDLEIGNSGSKKNPRYTFHPNLDQFNELTKIAPLSQSEDFRFEEEIKKYLFSKTQKPIWELNTFSIEELVAMADAIQVETEKTKAQAQAEKEEIATSEKSQQQTLENTSAINEETAALEKNTQAKKENAEAGSYAYGMLKGMSSNERRQTAEKRWSSHAHEDADDIDKVHVEKVVKLSEFYGSTEGADFLKKKIETLKSELNQKTMNKINESSKIQEDLIDSSVKDVSNFNKLKKEIIEISKLGNSLSSEDEDIIRRTEKYWTSIIKLNKYIESVKKSVKDGNFNSQLMSDNMIKKGDSISNSSAYDLLIKFVESRGYVGGQKSFEKNLRKVFDQNTQKDVDYKQNADIDIAKQVFIKDARTSIGKLRQLLNDTRRIYSEMIDPIQNFELKKIIKKSQISQQSAQQTEKNIAKKKEETEVIKENTLAKEKNAEISAKLTTTTTPTPTNTTPVVTNPVVTSNNEKPISTPTQTPVKTPVDGQITQEIEAIKKLEEELRVEVPNAIEAKNAAFRGEQTVVEEVVSAEREKLGELETKINEVKGAISSAKDGANNPKLQQDLTSLKTNAEGSKQIIANTIQSEAETFTPLIAKIDDVILKIRDKTSAFKEEQATVEGVVLEEINYLDALTGTLILLKQEITEVATSFARIKNKNVDIKVNVETVESVKSKFDEIIPVIEDFATKINEIKFEKKAPILTQIDAITSKAKELENLAKILSETESKIQLASQTASNEVTNAIVKDETRKQEAYQQTAQIKNKSLTVEFDKTSNSIAEFRESAESIGISPSAVDGIVGQLEKLNLEITKITTNFHKSKDSAEQYIKKLTVSAIDGTHEVKIVQNFDKDQKMIDTDTTVVSKLKEEKRAADDTAKAEDKLADIRKKVLKAQGIGNVANINFDNVENVDLIKAKITELQQLTQNFDATAPLKEQEMAYQQIENIVNELTASVKKYNETNNTKIKVDVDQDSLEQAQRILNKRFEVMKDKLLKIGIDLNDTSNQDLKTAINTFNANKESYDSKNLGKANKALQEMNLEYQKQNNILKENKKVQDQNYESRLAEFKNLLDAINKVNASLKDESVISNETKLSEQLAKRKELYVKLADFLNENGYKSIDSIQAEITNRGKANDLVKKEIELLEQLKAIVTTENNQVSFLNGQVLSAKELDNLLKDVYKKYNALKSVQNKGNKPMTAEDSRALTAYENIIVAVRNSLMGLKSGEELATNSVFRFTDGTEQAVERVREFIKDIDNLNAKFAITGKAPKGNVISSEITNIDDFKAMARKDANFKGTVKGNSNPKIQELGNGLYQIDYEIIDTEKNIKKLSYQWNESMKSMAVSTNTVTSTSRGLGAVIDSVKKKIGQLATYWTAMYLNPYMMIGEIRQAVSQVVELDTALVDLRKTANMSTQELNAFYNSSNDIAKQMGVTTKEIISQAGAWSRFNIIDPLYSNV